MVDGGRGQGELGEVIEAIIGSTGSVAALVAESLRAGELIGSTAAFAFRLDGADGSVTGAVSDEDLLGTQLPERVVATGADCPINLFHLDGHPEEVVVLSRVTEVDSYMATDHYREIYGESGTTDALSIPFGSDGDIARVIICRRGEGFGDGDIETARILQPVLAGCLRQSRAMEKLNSNPLSEQAMRDHGLTAREAEIFTRLAGGATSQAVGQELGISVRTVEKHVQNIYARLGARNRAEAISVLLGSPATVAGALLVASSALVSL